MRYFVSMLLENSLKIKLPKDQNYFERVLYQKVFYKRAIYIGTKISVKENYYDCFIEIIKGLGYNFSN